MTNSGGDTFTGYIPYYLGGDYISYKILAYDKAGNEAVRDYGGRYYGYSIIAEFPLISSLFILIISTMFITLFVKKRHDKP